MTDPRAGDILRDHRGNLWECVYFVQTPTYVLRLVEKGAYDHLTAPPTYPPTGKHLFLQPDDELLARMTKLVPEAK